jgi:hypothetical protein
VSSRTCQWEWQGLDPEEQACVYAWQQACKSGGGPAPFPRARFCVRSGRQAQRRAGANPPAPAVLRWWRAGATQELTSTGTRTSGPTPCLVSVSASALPLALSADLSSGIIGNCEATLAWWLGGVVALC